MLGSPTILCGRSKYGVLVSDVGVFERELSHAKFRQPIDIIPYQLNAVDHAAGHDARCANRQILRGTEELLECRRGIAHQFTIASLIEMMP